MTLPSASQPSCPRCGAPVSATALFCRGCGQALTSESRRFCPACGRPSAPAARFCKECGQNFSVTSAPIAAPPPITVPPPVTGPPPPPTLKASSRSRSPMLVIVAGGLLIIISVLAAGGYFGYRYWSSLPAASESAGNGEQEVDAEWGSADLAPPDLRQARTEVDPHVARLAEAVKNGNVAQVLALTLPEAREDLKAAFEAHPDRMERFGRLLATRRLTAFEGDLAEFEVTEGGRVFVLTFQRVGSTWALHSY
ncbi:MAG: zinc ribbon domain-containing protein [Acidobacteria bacterium]|nr:MAG: zinc ribbon domain-containing protein [Acidobacteriota bacterium]